MGVFKIQKQQQSEWCWAAVAVSIDKYFNPASTLKQCQLVNSALNSNNDACKTPTYSNQTFEVANALQIVNRLRLSLPGALSFDQLRQEIDAGRPVCAAIAWDSGGGHAVIVDAYKVLPSGACQVHVSDPLNPSSFVDFEEFSKRYYGDGVWKETALTRGS